MERLMKKQIEEIRLYTCQNPELLQAHHFLFDLRLSEKEPQYVVMGINPGETTVDSALHRGPTEETSEFDYHAKAGRGKSSKRWLTEVEFFLQTDRVVLSEYFFWSSQDMKQFKELFGSFEKSRHLPFCRDMNMQLINRYQPRAIISPGLRAAKTVAPLYDLKHVRSIKANNGHTLIEHFSGESRPWIFTKHWTGSRGFSNAQRQQIRSYISAL
jgi:hypothetical protein